ncbi:MAG: YIP1 family protein [candidate division Zixibacteria bacterium]|nr:YIP1 family protein [candidate division Zixibacteria bacterium]MDD5426244.1 YIP1 family protein [candidate division Zixibacteria bacterium]
MENINNPQVTPAMAISSDADKGLSIRGLFEVFYKPAQFFENLKNHPKILIPYIAILILTMVTMYLMMDAMVTMQIESPQLQERLQGQQLPENARNFMRISTFVAGVIFSMLIPPVAALLAVFFGNFIMAGKARYKQVLSVMLYGQFLFDAGGILTALFIYMKGQMMAPFSLGFLAIDKGFQSLPFVALSKIDLFNIWEIIVVGIGLAAVYGFVRNKGYWLSVLSVGMLSVLHVLLTAIGSLF